MVIPVPHCFLAGSKVSKFRLTTNKCIFQSKNAISFDFWKKSLFCRTYIFQCGLYIFHVIWPLWCLGFDDFFFIARPFIGIGPQGSVRSADVFLQHTSSRKKPGMASLIPYSRWWTAAFGGKFHTFELLISRPCRPLSLVPSMDDQTHQDHFKGLTLSPTRSDGPGMSWNLSDAEEWLKNKWQSNPSSILIILSIISLSAGPFVSPPTASTAPNN